MARVTVEDCLRKVPNRFALVHLAARRAKQILKGSHPLIKKDNKEVVIKMEPKVTMLNEVEIGAEKIINLIHEKPLYLIDYEFFENNILLIAYEEMKISKGILILMDYHGDTICRRGFDNPKKLYKDCLDMVHVFDQEKAYQIYYDGKTLDLLYPVGIDTFLLVMDHCVDKFGQKLFFKNYSLKNQQLVYSYFDSNDSSFHTFTESKNEALIPTVQNWDQYVRAYYVIVTGYGDAERRFY